jgi:hypothetical protein
MNKTALAALVLVLAAPAGAQEYRQQQAKAAQDSYDQLQAENARRRSDPAPYAGRVLDATLASPKPIFGRILSLLTEKKIEVYLVTQDEAVKPGVFVKDVAGAATPVHAILISDALSANPSMYVALIAAEAAKEMYADAPAGAERAYLRAATVARAYAEAGGTVPLVDGNPNDAKAVKDAVAVVPEVDAADRADADARFQAFLDAGAAKPKP